jgi:hypothetical protein
MPNVYKALSQNQVPHLIGIHDAPGKIIMRGIPVHARTMDNLFTEFCRYFRTQWTWDGGPATPTAAAILDGDSHLGQCLALARALHVLAVTPWPHGLGLAAATVGDPYASGRYKGRYGKGFISAHPLAGVLHLNPNVFDTTNANFAQCGHMPLYAWSDHKAVPFNGRFYDPSYGQVWNSLLSMATDGRQS